MEASNEARNGTLDPFKLRSIKEKTNLLEFELYIYPFIAHSELQSKTNGQK